MNSVKFRFIDELNDFLKSNKKGILFDFVFEGNPSVKDIIESFGVPHVEVDVIFVDNVSVPFNYNLKDGDIVTVYPSFGVPDNITKHLKENSGDNPSFIADIQLGKLSRFLRMLGFDALYNNNYDTKEIINISLEQNRTILTRNVFLLKNSLVNKGYWIRSQDSYQQILQVLKYSRLLSHIKLFYRCIECNGILVPVKKELIAERLMPNTKKYFNDFHICSNCKNIYWKGSHYKKMAELVDKIKQDAELLINPKTTI